MLYNNIFKSRLFYLLVLFSFISGDNRNEALSLKKDLPFNEEQLVFNEEEVQYSLPSYLTYLRIHQQKTIKGPEIMGGSSISRTRSGDVCTCLATFPIIIPNSYPYHDLELLYITESSDKIQKANFFIWSLVYYNNIRIGTTKINFPSKDKADLSYEKLYMSIDGKDWYPYLVLDYGLIVEFMRLSPMPMQINPRTGLPIPLLESLKESNENDN